MGLCEMSVSIQDEGWTKVTGLEREWSSCRSRVEQHDWKMTRVEWEWEWALWKFEMHTKESIGEGWVEGGGGEGRGVKRAWREQLCYASQQFRNDGDGEWCARATERPAAL